jgi:hypothetical protein
MPEAMRPAPTPSFGVPVLRRMPNRYIAQSPKIVVHSSKNSSRGRICQPNAKSTIDTNLNAAASSTNPSETLSVSIHSPDRGIDLTLVGISESTTNGSAIVNPKIAMPTPTRSVPTLATFAINEPTIGAVHVNEVITSVAPMKKTPA